MSLALFKVGNTDLTNKIINGSYSVNNIPEYNEWKDGAGVTHKDFVRDRVEGNFTMSFANMSEYNAFLSLLSSVKTASGAYTVDVKCINTAQVENITANVDFEPTLIQKPNLQTQVSELNISIWEL